MLKPRIIFLICLLALTPGFTVAEENPPSDPISDFRAEVLRNKAALESIKQIQLELLKFAQTDPKAAQSSRPPKEQCVEVLSKDFCEYLKGTFQ